MNTYAFKKMVKMKNTIGLKLYLKLHLYYTLWVLPQGLFLVVFVDFQNKSG